MKDEFYKQYEKIMLENSMPIHLIFKTFKELAETNIFYNYKNELETYKQKEDKLREYIYSVNNWNWKKLEGKNGTQIIREELLQILNEGDK